MTVGASSSASSYAERSSERPAIEWKSRVPEQGRRLLRELVDVLGLFRSGATR